VTAVFATANALAAKTSAYSELTAGPGMWSEVYVPASALGSIARAAEAGVRHVCTAVVVVLSAAGTAQTNPVSFTLWDGASGTTRVWVAHAGAGVNVTRPVVLTAVSLVGSVGLAMTLEASGGPLLATSVVSMTLVGYSIAE